MRMSRLPLLTLSFLLALAASASAVTFNLAGDWLADEQGVQGIPNGSLIMLVASTQDETFAPPSAQGLVNPGSDDVILGVFGASDDKGKANRGSYAATIQVNFGDSEHGLEHFGAGDPLLIRWFPTLRSTNLSDLPEGPVPYGEFRTDETLFGSNASWRTPGSNSAIINLSIVAGSVGSRYNPQGPLTVAVLSAKELASFAVKKAARAHLTLSALGNGWLLVSWPLLDGADPVGRLQESIDLKEWTDATVSLDLSESGKVSAITHPRGGTKFYRITSSGNGE